MRRDARKLLEKLNRRDFAYREFEDRFSETELWPIFAAVLGDQKVVGDDAARLPVPQVRQQDERPAPRAPQPPAAPGQIFARYDAQPRRAAPKANVDQIGRASCRERVCQSV